MLEARLRTPDAAHEARRLSCRGKGMHNIETELAFHLDHLEPNARVNLPAAWQWLSATSQLSLALRRRRSHGEHGDAWLICRCACRVAATLASLTEPLMSRGVAATRRQVVMQTSG